MSIKKLTTLALFTTLSLGIYAVESAIPPLVPIPGIKLGLANIITLILLQYGTLKDAALVLTARILVNTAVWSAFKSGLQSGRRCLQLTGYVPNQQITTQKNGFSHRCCRRSCPQYGTASGCLFPDCNPRCTDLSALSDLKRYHHRLLYRTGNCLPCASFASPGFSEITLLLFTFPRQSFRNPSLIFHPNCNSSL